MKKAALTTLCAIFIVSAGSAQNPAAPTQVAEDEAVRRQADTVRLRKKLQDAQTEYKRGDLTVAAKLYEDSYALVQQIGSGIDQEARQAIDGLINTRMELAKEAQRQGDLSQADAQVRRVLKVDPKNAAALTFKKENDALMASQ